MMKMEKHLPLIAMIIVQLIYAGMSLFSKASMSSGIKPSIFVAYRQAFATLALAPFALYFEREKCPPLRFYGFCKIFVVASVGIALSLNLHYIGLQYASATVGTAIPNTTPAAVFIFALCLRMEKLAITKRYGMAKVLGTILCLSGAMAFIFYKGPPIFPSSNNNNDLASNSITKTSTTQDEWIKGSLFILVANWAWSMWLILQGPLLKEYPAKLRLTTLQCACSCVTTTIYAAFKERNIASWKLGWDVNLLSIIYCGVIVTAITYWLQVWVVAKRGPVYAAIFGPLALIVTALFSAIFLHEILHWGSALGGLLLIGGLYSFLWGKKKEAQSMTQDKLDNPKEKAQLESIVVSKSVTEEEKKDSTQIN